MPAQDVKADSTEQAKAKTAAPDAAPADAKTSTATTDSTAAPATETTPAAPKTGSKLEDAAEKALEGLNTKIDEGTTDTAVPDSTLLDLTPKDPATATETVKPDSGSELAHLTDKSDEAAGTGVPSNVVFLMGLGLLTLFVLYFAAEKEKRKRVIGTILTISVAALCVWFYSALGIDKGIELQGGVSMEIRIKPGEGKKVTPDSQQQVIDVLSKRLNALGTGEVLLAPQGEDGVFLQMPGVGQERLEEITEQLEKVAKLEFSILHPQSSALALPVANGAQVIPGYEALPYKPEFDDEGNEKPTRYGLVKIKKDMAGKYVKSAHYFYGQSGDSIGVEFTGEGANIMGPLTMEHINEPLAIIMDGVILSSPVIRDQFSTGCSITGDFTREEAQALASALENPLENPIEIAYSNFITPTMGKKTIEQGILAGVAGLALTLLFIVIYYRFAGILALVGLCLSMVIIFGCMALFQFTLTLPGIAGIILTIGVAIDANVLIYERLREEMAAGKSLKSAINTAYEKAFSAIIDANITTLITAIILYAVAAGTVKGFAITLIIGIFATLFSALLVTRVAFNWVTETNLLKKLSFMNMVPDKTIDFLGKRKICLVGSLILIVVSLIVVPTMDPRGVELKGGDSLTIQTDLPLSKADIENSIAKLDLGGKPIVQMQRPVGADGEFFLVRAPDNTADKIQQELAKDLNMDMKDTTVSSVGSAVGEAMLISSGTALLIGLFAILIYVTLRFEFAFALGAIAALFHDLIVVAGLTTLLGQEVTLITVGAFLTIAGYSINDTIVVFDRVREDLTSKRGDVRDIMNYALNKTLSRTLLTSLTTLLTVLVLFLFGGPGLRNFALTLIIGVVVGTYSSIFIASPIVLWWARRSGTNLRRQVLDTEQSKIDAATSQGA